MKTITKLLAGAAVALSMSAASAQAAVFVSFDGVNVAYSTLTDADPTNDEGGNFEFDVDCGTFACGGWEDVVVAGQALDRPSLLHSATVQANTNYTGSASITVYVTRTNFAPLGNDQFQSFTSLNNGGSVNVRLDQYVSNSNELFDGFLIGTMTHNANGSKAQNTYTNFDFSAPGTYSVTQKYTLFAPAVTTGSATAGRSASPTMGLSVPEPGTWALMIMGFGGAGAMLRNRRKAVATA